MKKPTKLEEKEYADYYQDAIKMNNFWVKLGRGYEDQQNIIWDLEQYTRQRRKMYGRDLDDDDDNDVANGMGAVKIGIGLFFLLIFLLIFLVILFLLFR